MKADVVLVSASTAGHRAAYIAVFSTLFRSRVRPPGIRLAIERRPVLFLMVEECFGIYVAVALLRSLFGRRTVGLLFRPGPALAARTLRTRLKALLLRLCRRARGITTLTIVPFSVEPRFAEIAAGWIYDPQLWDLDPKSAADAAFAESIKLAAGNRRVVAAIGRQDTDKGFDLFARSYAASPGLRQDTLFVAAGAVAPGVALDADALRQAGGVVVDRFVSDAEVLALYAVADLVWCAYAPDYDQASGIFGRAVQVGIPAIVRENSLIHRHCIEDRLAHVAVTAGSVASAIAGLADWTRTPNPSRTAAWRSLSIARLSQALGLAS